MKRGIGAILGLVLLCASCAKAAPGDKGSAQDQRASSGLIAPIEHAVASALAVHQSLGVPTSDVRSPMTHARVVALRSIEAAKIATHFTGSEASREAGAMENILQGEESGTLRVLGGWTRELRFSRVVLDSDSAATATGSVVTYLDMELRSQGSENSWSRATPHNTLLFTITLARSTDNIWRVSSFEWTFAPGTGP